jgi:DNA-binding transcriptional LysR family regulator
MNINVMKTFCDLVDSGGFSRAAESNFISQSAVSQQLAKLESDLGVQLISRGGGLVTPTEAGKAFYRGAREILHRHEQLLGEVKSAADAVRGVLRVGTIYSVGFYLLDSYVRRFMREHSEVDLHLEYTGWNRICAAVIGGEMDLGVLACPEKNRSLEIVPLVSEELVVVCSSAHRLALRRTLEPRELAGEAFVGFAENIPTRRHIDKLLKAARTEVNIAIEFDNIELLKRAIMVGAGLSILPKGNVETECARGDLAFIRFGDAKNWTRPVAMVRRRGKKPTPAAQKFLAMLKK